MYAAAPLSPSSVARLVELAHRLSEENAQLKEALGRSSSRRSSTADCSDGAEGVGEALEGAGRKASADSLPEHLLDRLHHPRVLTFPLTGSSLPPPAHSLSLSAPSSTSEREPHADAEDDDEAAERSERKKSRRGGGGGAGKRQQPRYYPTMQSGMARRINELRGDVLQGLTASPSSTSSVNQPPSSTTSASLPLHSLQPLPPLPSSSSSAADARLVVDRTRSLPLRTARPQRKTAPADLSAMMEQWRHMQTQPPDAHTPTSTTTSHDKASSASATTQEPSQLYPLHRPLHQHSDRGPNAGKRGSGSGSAKPADTSGSAEDARAGSSSDEDEVEVERRRLERERERRQSWVKGAATMNHAEVRMMMHMMKIATAQDSSYSASSHSPRNSLTRQPPAPSHHPDHPP